MGFYHRGLNSKNDEASVAGLLLSMLEWERKIEIFMVLLLCKRNWFLLIAFRTLFSDEVHGFGGVGIVL